MNCCTKFAIRPTIRNHGNLKRDVVINTIAGLINDDRHKVNLTSPDKVILVDVYQVSSRSPDSEYAPPLTLLLCRRYAG
jgi:tRNA acetyltransferase TAN1